MSFWLPLLILAAQASLDVPRLRFDLDASSLTVELRGEAQHFDLGEPCSWERWDAFVGALAAGDGRASEARAWGEILFPPACRQELSARTHWQIEPLSMAGLDAVVPPWSDDEALVATTRLDFALQTSDSKRYEIARVLTLAPFVTERFDPLDAPDTLNAAWAATLRELRQLPRNDVDPMLLRELLEGESRALLSLRALAELPRGWALQWEVAAPLRVWVWPGAAEACDASSFVTQCEALSRGAAIVWADRWPLAESSRASDYVALFDAMNAGAGAGEALHAHKRSLYAAGHGARRWAGWIALGDTEIQLATRAPSWWQGWLRARKAKSLGVELP